MPPHRAGGKLTRSHTTLIDAAVPLVDALQDHPAVTKIALGLIRNVGKGLPGLKFHATPAGFRLVVRGNVSLQEIQVYTSAPDAVRAMLSSLA